MWHTIARYSGFAVSAVISSVVIKRMTLNPTGRKLVVSAVIGASTLVLGKLSMKGVDALFERKSKATQPEPQQRRQTEETPLREREESRVD